MNAGIEFDNAPKLTDFQPLPLSGGDHPVDAAGRKLLFSADGDASLWEWECTAGDFIWEYSEDEYVTIIRGRVSLQEMGPGTFKYMGEFGAGDVILFRAGTVVYWSVLEPVRKIAVFHRPRGGALREFARALKRKLFPRKQEVLL